MGLLVRFLYWWLVAVFVCLVLGVIAAIVYQ